MEEVEARRSSRRGKNQPGCEATPSFRRHSCFICVISFRLEVDRLPQRRRRCPGSGWSSKREKSIYFYGPSVLKGRWRNFKRDGRKNNTDIKTFPVFCPTKRRHVSLLLLRWMFGSSRLLLQVQTASGSCCSSATAVILSHWSLQVLQPKKHF